MKQRWFQIAVMGLIAGGIFLFAARPEACLTAPAAGGSGLEASTRLSSLLVFTAQEGEGESQDNGRKAFFEWLNFAILVGGLFYLLRKPLASFFGARSVSILKALGEGRKALEESGAKLKLVEWRLERLNEDIAALQAEAAKEMEAEAERMRRQAIVEAERISESARAQIEAAIRAAKIELKTFAANQATEIAGQMVRGQLNSENHGKLVQRFFEGLNGKN